MKIVFAILLAAIIIKGVTTATAQSMDPFIQSVVDQVSYDTLQTQLLKLESYGRKQFNDPALEYTAEWLMSNYNLYGYTDVQTDTFTLFGISNFNIIVTKEGTLYPDRYIIIDGHYDTKTGPGVNDNGTGVAIILEIARLMQNIQTHYSIKFINFSGEEYGLVGSSHYVENVVVPQNMDIRLVFNIDEVGGVAGMLNDIVVCERDEAAPASNNAESWAFTDTLATLAEIYSDLTPTISYAYGSDYVPFQSNGEIITGIFEDNYSPYPHTVHDSLVNLDMDYVFEMAKISVAAALYFAGATDTGTGDTQSLFELPEVIVYPNPFRTFLNLNLKVNYNGLTFILYDDKGDEKIIMNSMQIQSQTFSTQLLKSGLYMYRVIDENGALIKSGKLVKVQ